MCVCFQNEALAFISLHEPNVFGCRRCKVWQLHQPEKFTSSLDPTTGKIQTWSTPHGFYYTFPCGNIWLFSNWKKIKTNCFSILAKLEIKGRSRVNVIYRMKDNTELGPILKSSIEKLKPHVSLVAPQILSHAGQTQHCCQSLDLLHSAYLEGENPNLCVIQKYTSDFDNLNVQSKSRSFVQLHSG